MDIAKSEDEIVAEEIVKILKTFFETDKHVLLTAPPGHGKTWAINRIYDIFKFQKLFDEHREEVLQLKEELKQETFEMTFKLLFEKFENKDDEISKIMVEDLVYLYIRILCSVSGNHSSLHDYIVNYLERYMSSAEISNQFNNDIIKIAPTGVAANNIQGMTYHSFFALNIFSNSEQHKISNADSRIIRYLQNMDGYGIAELLYRIPDGQDKIITDNYNLFRVINQEIIIFDEISMIYDLSLDLLWKLTHDLQDVVRKIHNHFRNIKEYNDTRQKKRFYTGIEKDIRKAKINYVEMMISMDSLNLMFHIAAFFFEMIPEKFDIDFKTFSGPLRRKETYGKIAGTINKRYVEDILEEQLRYYLENLCLKTVYNLFCKQFQKMGLEVPYEIKLFYDVMRSCNSNYKFISNMKEIDSIKPIKFLFVGDYLQIQPFKKSKNSNFKAKKIANYYLETKSVANKTISLYKDVNSFFSDVFADSNNIEKLTLTICKRQTKEESDFRNLISDMRLGMPMSERSRELLKSPGKIISYTVNDLLRNYIIDKNNFTVLSMSNSYANHINSSLILRDYEGDIDLIPNTCLVKNIICYEGRKENVYLNDFISVVNIEAKISQLCYINCFLKRTSMRRSFHVTLDKTKMDFLEHFRDNLRSAIIEFFENTMNAFYVYNSLDKFYKSVVEVYEIKDNGRTRYRYYINRDNLDKVSLIISLDKEHKIKTLRNNLNDFRKDIEEKVESILSKNNLDLDAACKKFLDDIKKNTPDGRTVTLHKLRMKLRYHNNSKIYDKEIDSEIVLPIFEDQVIKIREIPVKKAIRNINTSDEFSNINIFVKDMKCMVTKNKRVYKSVTEFKYVNGSMGNFIKIDKYGKLFLELKDQGPVIVSPEIEHQSGNFFCLQFPIVPAYSFSTNKSQGLTISDKVILNLNQNNGGMWWHSDKNKDWFFNLVVAISRCTKLENLIINRYIDRNPNNINNLSLSDFIDYMFDDMYNRADPKSKLIFDIERDKERCQKILREMHDLRRRFNQ